ncbi:hypothetical protein LTR95_002936 [Oleoguttula sp. CCFEE 5521]
MSALVSAPEQLESGGEALLAVDSQCAQDVAGDMDTFARLARAGHFARAEVFFDEVLSGYQHLFPVAAEYGDMLIEQGAYGKAEEFLEKAFASTTDQQPVTKELVNEQLVLKLLHAIASMHTKLRVSDALNTANDALSSIADQDLMGIKMQISVLGLRVLGYQKSYDFVRTPDHANTASTVREQPKSQTELLVNDEVRLDALLDHLVTTDKFSDAANLQSLRAAYHGHVQHTTAWQRRFSAMYEAQDAGVVLAGLTMLGNSSQTVLIQAWRDLLAESEVPEMPLTNATPQYINFLIQVYMVLNERNPLADREMDEIDDALKTSRAYQYLRLIALDQELLKSVQDQREKLIRYTQPDSHEKILEEVAEHASAHRDFWLQNEVLLRKACISRDLDESAFCHNVTTLWQSTKDSWSCVRMLITSQLRSPQASKETEAALRSITTYSQTGLQASDPPPLPQSWQARTKDTDPRHRHCKDTLEVLSCWKRKHGGAVGNTSLRPLSLLEFSVRSKAFSLQSAMRSKPTLGLFQDPISTRAMPGSWPQPKPESSNDPRVPLLAAMKGSRENVKTLLFLGHTGTGKSSTINALTGSALLTSDHTDPCTSDIATVTRRLGEHEIECIDTPGFGDRRFSDVQVLRMVQGRLKSDYRKTKRLHAVFYLLNIDTPRIDRALATDLSVFFKLVGDGEDSGDIWKKVCFVYTHGIDPHSKGRGIADKLRTQNVRFDDWKETLDQAIRRGAHSCHLIEATGADDASTYIEEVRAMALEMLESPGNIVLQCQVEMCQNNVPLDQTGAASELITAIYHGDEELREAERQGQRDIAAKEQEVSALKEQRYEARERPLTNPHDRPLGGHPAGMKQSGETAGGQSLAAPSTSVVNDDAVRVKKQRKSEQEKEAEEEAKIRQEESRTDAEELAEKPRKEAELEHLEHESKIKRLREELDSLKRDQQAVKEKRAKFLREQKEIEESPHFLPRFMVFNRSNVNVHLRLYSQPFHLVWCYANNVVPGSFATLTCPLTGIYKIEVSLATGTVSEFSTAGQVACTMGKITLGAVTVVGGMFGGAFASALGAKIVLKGGVAAMSDVFMSSAAFAGGTYGATDGNDRARRILSAIAANARIRNADIAIVAEGEIDASCYELMQAMRQAADGRHSLTLVKRPAMKLWRKRRLTLRHGPDLVLDDDHANGSVDQIKYRFTSTSQPMTLEDREEFDADAPSSPQVDPGLAYGSLPYHSAFEQWAA